MLFWKIVLWKIENAIGKYTFKKCAETVTDQLTGVGAGDALVSKLTTLQRGFDDADATRVCLRR